MTSSIDRLRGRTRPNIVMIVLDDLGFGDLGCYGSATDTPAFDRLAREGLRYNGFHVTAICSATRACLMTGRNHHAVGMGYVANDSWEAPGYTSRIPRSAGTLPRALRDAGYGTFAVGKWHLAPIAETGPAGPFERWPLGMGFDRYYGFMEAMTNQWSPTLVRDNTCVDPELPTDGPYHLTEDLASQAIRYLQGHQQAAPNRPFFLYFATGAVHTPHHVPRDWIDAYDGTFDGGWDAHREETFARQKDLGVIPETAVLTERPPWVAAWDTLPPEERRVYARMMETYAGFVSHTDAQIHRLLTFLEDAQLLDDTIVLALSDNGASPDGGPQGYLGLDSRKGFEPTVDRLAEIGEPTTHNHYPWGWAWAGNTPFRLWKHYTWLGGVRVPLIVRWPEGIPASERGRVRGQFCHAVDLMPTLFEVCDVDAPAVVDGAAQQRIDGASVAATFADANAESPRDTQYFEMSGSRAIYHDGWKATTDHVPAEHRLLVAGSHSYDNDRWLLFRLDDDFTEAHDRSESDPQQLKKMVETWWYEAGRNQVLPLAEATRYSDIGLPYEVRDRYVCFDGAGPTYTPSPFKGFRLEAVVDVADVHDASGIITTHRLVAAGAELPEGWAWYLLERRLVAACTYDGTTSTITSREQISAGRHELCLAYTRGSDTEPGRVTMAVDACEVGTGRIDTPEWDAVLAAPPAKLRAGSDRGHPLSGDYQPPFSFTGRVVRVVLDSPGTSS
jgi:arylsulfatase A-like enzyme